MEPSVNIVKYLAEYNDPYVISQSLFNRSMILLNRDVIFTSIKIDMKHNYINNCVDEYRNINKIQDSFTYDQLICFVQYNNLNSILVFVYYDKSHLDRVVLESSVRSIHRI